MQIKLSLQWELLKKISEEPFENLFTHCAIFRAFWLSAVEWLENSGFDRCEDNALALWKTNAIN